MVPSIYEIANIPNGDKVSPCLRGYIRGIARLGGMLNIEIKLKIITINVINYTDAPVYKYREHLAYSCGQTGGKRIY